MKLFACQACGQLLLFENTKCERCGHQLGYLPDRNVVSAIEADGDVWKPLAGAKRRFRYCENALHGACNWLVPVESAERFCLACRHNNTIPDLDQTPNLARWQTLETAKHRMFYSLVRLGLPLRNREDDPDHGLEFDFLGDKTGAPRVLTGHDGGRITISLTETDPAEREKMRVAMGEQYRTLLGHFRHEVGHYYWDVLVRDGGKLDACRAMFGDDGQDYEAALKRHYAQGAPLDWQESFISAYATSHPWEDFAETWAHYLHIVDTLETASAFGLRVSPKAPSSEELRATIDFDPYAPGDFTPLVNAWLPLTFAVNSLNRSMGQPDLYPFVLSPPVIEKLGFIHDLVHGLAARPHPITEDQEPANLAPEQLEATSP